MELSSQNFSYNLFDEEKGISDRLFSKAKHYSVIKATDRSLSETAVRRFPEDIINDTKAKKLFIKNLTKKKQTSYDDQRRKAHERYIKSDRYKQAQKRKKLKERQAEQAMQRAIMDEIRRDIMKEYPRPKYLKPRHGEWTILDKYKGAHGYVKGMFYVFHHLYLRYDTPWQINQNNVNQELDDILDQVEYHFETIIDRIWEYADGEQRYIFKMITPQYDSQGKMLYDNEKATSSDPHGFGIERSGVLKTKEQMQGWVRELTQAFADKVGGYLRRKMLSKIEISELMIEEVVEERDFISEGAIPVKPKTNQGSKKKKKKSKKPKKKGKK